MNIGSFIASEKETYGIFFDNYAQSVTDDFKNKYNSLREVVEKKILPLMYENALKTSKLKHSQIKFLPPIINPTKIICIGMNYRKPYPVMYYCMRKGSLSAESLMLKSVSQMYTR